MKKKILYPVLFLVILLVSCNDSDKSFDNNVYIDSFSKVGEVLLKAGMSEAEMTIQAAIAKPEDNDISITYKADMSLVDKYNKAYYDKAIALPSDNFELNTTKVNIKAGNVKANSVKVSLKNLDVLDRDIVYVLPVTIDNSNISVLESAKTVYYVIKGAALINVVADIEDNYLTINWTNPDVCNNLSQLTLEALIRVRDFDRLISTVMGIEGNFLIRIGDAGYPSNQIQVATNRGNFPDPDSNKGLPTNEWIHIALTYDSADGSLILYVNGAKQAETNKNLGNVNLGQGGTGGFCIGRSYADDRFLAGNISECRIWNIVRTPAEIAANPYYVNPESEGLVAYWKFDDESALSVKDHTANGNHAVAKSTLIWSPVSLPAKEE